MAWIERHRHLLDFALSGLLRRKWQHLGLFSVFTMMVFLPASAIFFGSALRHEGETLLASAPDIVVQRIIAGRQVFVPNGYLERVQGIRGVRSVRLRLWGYYANPVNGCNYTIMVPPIFSHGESDLIVGEGVMRTWGAVQDRRLFFTTHDRQAILMNAVESLDAATGLISSDLILMSEAAFRRVSGLPRGFSADLVVSVKNSREVPIVAGKIARAIPDALPILKEDILRTYRSVFSWRSGIVMVLFMGALLAFLILGWDQASGHGDEQRLEIGILKAVGWGSPDILAVKFWEGASIAVNAFAAGVMLAYVHVFMMSAPIFAPILKGWSVLYPRFDLPPAIDGGDLALLFLMSVVPYMLMTIVPAWRAATLPPDAVMRYR